MKATRSIRILGPLMLIACGATSIAQNEVTLESLKAPGMPAGSIIGTQINEITRPKSLKALEAAIMGNFLDEEQQNITVPNGYGLEVQPFMLGSLKNFDYEDYIRDDLDVGETLWRNLALSVASTNEFLIKDSVTTDAIGTGVRLVFHQGKLSKELKEAFQTALGANRLNLRVKGAAIQAMGQKLIAVPGATLDVLKTTASTDVKSLLDNDATLTATVRQELLANVDAVLKALPASTLPAQASNVFESLYDEMFLNGILTEFKKVVERVGTERYHWHVEFNAATSWHFPTSEIGNSYTGQYGGWFTVAYRPKKTVDGKETATASDFILLLRGIGHHTDFYERFEPLDSMFDRGTNMDIGLKYAYTKPRWALEFEWIYRMNRIQEIRVIDDLEYHRNIDNGSYKLMLNFNYAIAPNVNLSYNFGKAFDDVFTTSDLISVVNLSMGFGGLDAQKIFSP